MSAGQGLIPACWALAVTQFPRSCTFRAGLEDKPLGVEPVPGRPKCNTDSITILCGKRELNGLHQAVMVDTLRVPRPPMI